MVTTLTPETARTVSDLDPWMKNATEADLLAADFRLHMEIKQLEAKLTFHGRSTTKPHVSTLRMQLVAEKGRKEAFRRRIADRLKELHGGNPNAGNDAGKEDRIAFIVGVRDVLERIVATKDGDDIGPIDAEARRLLDSMPTCYRRLVAIEDEKSKLKPLPPGVLRMNRETGELMIG